jgi:hypothetical protein
MKTLAKVGSVVGLLLTIVPAVLVFNGYMSLEQNRVWMTVGTVVWFVATPVWMKPSS